MKISRRFKIVLITLGLVVMILSIVISRLWTLKNNQTYYDELEEALKNPEKAEVLVMRNRKMVTLSAEIGKLSHLKILNIGNNELKDLPPEIGQLKELEELSVENNLLTSIPEEILKLNRLRKVNLNKNRLTHFPWINPQSIEEIHVCANNIVTIPGEIRNMKQLKVIDLAENQLVQIPDDVIFPDSITKLDFFHNGLIHASPSLFSIPGLRELILEDNPLDTVSVRLYKRFQKH